MHSITIKILEALVLCFILFRSSYGLPFNGNNETINDKILRRNEGDNEGLTKVTIRTLLPKREESFHTVPLKSFDSLGIYPDMLSVQHADPKKLGTSNVFVKRFYIDPKSEKLLYDPRQRGQLKIVMRDFKESSSDSNSIFKRDHPSKSELQKRFYAGQQLAVLHGTMTQDQARESVRKQMNLFKDH